MFCWIFMIATFSIMKVQSFLQCVQSTHNINKIRIRNLVRFIVTIFLPTPKQWNIVLKVAFISILRFCKSNRRVMEHFSKWKRSIFFFSSSQTMFHSTESAYESLYRWNGYFETAHFMSFRLSIRTEHKPSTEERKKDGFKPYNRKVFCNHFIVLWVDKIKPFQHYSGFNKKKLKLWWTNRVVWTKDLCKWATLTLICIT